MNRLIVKRIIVDCCVIAGALAAPATASAAAPLAGVVSAVSSSSLTVQTPGRPVGVLAAMTAAAGRITKTAYPYVYGGGHAQVGVASFGLRGSRHKRARIGYDCSGSVAAVLAAGALWPAGAGVPNDAGVVAELLRERLIARGPGTGPVEVTLYDDPGVHIFMNVDGRFFGTSDGGGGGNPRGGAGWLDDGAPDASSRAYKRYHVLPSVLSASTDAAHSVTFELAGAGGSSSALQSSLGALQVGERVEVSYSQTRDGTLAATAIAYPGSITVSGMVQAIAADGSSLTLQESDGSTITLATSGVPQLLNGVTVGDTVQVTYVQLPSGPVPVTLAVTASATPGTGSTGSPPSAAG